MADNANEKTVKEIAAFIEEHNGQDTVVLNISELNSWTDYFVIATVSSSVQSQGIQKQIKDALKGLDLEVHKTNNKQKESEDWNLIDLGNIVVHLMSKEAREFYDLEKLWHAGKRLEF